MKLRIPYQPFIRWTVVVFWCLIPELPSLRVVVCLCFFLWRDYGSTGILSIITEPCLSGTWPTSFQDGHRRSVRLMQFVACRVPTHPLETPTWPATTQLYCHWNFWQLLPKTLSSVRRSPFLNGFCEIARTVKAISFWKCGRSAPWKRTTLLLASLCYTLGGRLYLKLRKQAYLIVSFWIKRYFLKISTSLLTTPALHRVDRKGWTVCSSPTNT